MWEEERGGTSRFLTYKARRMGVALKETAVLSCLGAGGGGSHQWVKLLEL